MSKLFNFSEKEFSLICAGEMIMRLSPINHELLIQGNSLTKQMGGAEFNVATSVSLLGEKVGILTKLPNNSIGEFAHKVVIANKISDKYLIFDDSLEKRMAIYYYEYGASPRKPKVTYDRLNSSFQTLEFHEIPEEIYSNTKIFHVSGITLGLSEKINEVTKKIVKKFKEGGAIISFDVNFRENLWSEKKAADEIKQILFDVDILFASEESFRKMFQQKGELKDVIKNFAQEYDLSIVSSSKREVNSSKSHNFSSIIFERATNTFYHEEAYKNIEVVDRIGSGDAYVAGVLFGILKNNSGEMALKYGNANAALKNTINGDTACTNLSILEEIIYEHEHGNTSEMSR
ncbi:sugar kinase [Fusobacterium necrophorum]|uniref:sugar kinase n=1 Tax=Fusobacterium necrophorum TaxID=859 RepID=UPI000430C25F|nr:sugar kinase [Fusobacterium necrophorum]EYD69682.1 carbohydrate kinase PfkB family protein [Fusobacterium necrophorum subsp. funduliforme B35]